MSYNDLDDVERLRREREEEEEYRRQRIEEMRERDDERFLSERHRRSDERFLSERHRHMLDENELNHIRDLEDRERQRGLSTKTKRRMITASVIGFLVFATIALVIIAIALNSVKDLFAA